LPPLTEFSSGGKPLFLTCSILRESVDVTQVRMYKFLPDGR